MFFANIMRGFEETIECSDVEPRTFNILRFEFSLTEIAIINPGDLILSAFRSLLVFHFLENTVVRKVKPDHCEIRLWLFGFFNNFNNAVIGIYRRYPESLRVAH